MRLLLIAVMAERGIDISERRSKHVDDLAGQRFDWVITVCDHARATCPVFSAAVNRLHRSFPDPATVIGGEADRLQAFREVRDSLENELSRFVRDVRDW